MKPFFVTAFTRGENDVIEAYGYAVIQAEDTDDAERQTASALMDWDDRTQHSNRHIVEYRILSKQVADAAEGVIEWAHITQSFIGHEVKLIPNDVLCTDLASAQVTLH